MNRPPLSVIIISGVFLLAGIVGVAYHATEFTTHGPFQYDLLLVCLVRLVAVICAVFLLRAANWARWVLVLWIAYHVVLSAFHSAFQLIFHGLLLALVTYFLFRPSTSLYFRGAKAAPARSNDQAP
jgi:hypothetical protein